MAPFIKYANEVDVRKIFLAYSTLKTYKFFSYFSLYKLVTVYDLPKGRAGNIELNKELMD